MNRPNILFVNLPTVSLADIETRFDNINFSRQAISMPLGVMYISSYIKEHSNVGKVGLIDYVLALQELLHYKNIDEFIACIAKRDSKFIPDILAISLNFSASYQFFERCLKVLLYMWPKSKVIVGGVHATNSTKVLLGHQDVDYVVRGEAELSLAGFVNQMSESKKNKVKGIYSKGNLPDSNELELNDWAFDLDELLFPDWELINMEAYTSSRGRQRDLDGKKQLVASIFTTRGCPFRCTFCSAHTVHGRKVRYRSVKNIVEEIKLLHERYGVTLFMPEDDLFTADRGRVLRLLRAIRDLKIPNLEIQLPAGLYVNTLDEEMADALIAAGMKIACLAIESGSEYTQKHIIKKRCDLKKAKWLVDLFKKKGITVRCFFIMGFPNETKSLMQETVDYMKSLGADWCILAIATPLIGSEMYDQFVKMGYIKDDIDAWSHTDFYDRYFDTAIMTKEELREFVYRVNLECNFLNNPNKINGEYKKAISIYKDIVALHPFHIIAWYCIMGCYKNLGDLEQSEQTERHMRNLILTDKRASTMFSKYGDMMPEFKL